MSENSETVRPTKKQREILTFIEQFIGEHGYSPSYREIMNGLQYTSVATIALHVNSLIRRGHLRKRDRSARSLEVVVASGMTDVPVTQNKTDQEKWLTDLIEKLFISYEQATDKSATNRAELQTLVTTLNILKLHAAAQSFANRLTNAAIPDVNVSVSTKVLKT